MTGNILNRLDRFACATKRECTQTICAIKRSRQTRHSELLKYIDKGYSILYENYNSLCSQIPSMSLDK